MASNEFSSAATSNETDVNACMGGSYEASGNWYSLTFDEDTCVSVYMRAPFSTLLSVYQGTNCSQTECVTYEMYGSGNLEWVASAGLSYLLFVGGPYSYDIGEYSLAITTSVCEGR